MIRRLSVVAAGMFLGLVFAVCLWRSRGGDGVLLVPRQIREPEHVVYFASRIRRGQMTIWERPEILWHLQAVSSVRWHQDLLCRPPIRVFRLN